MTRKVISSLTTASLLGVLIAGIPAQSAQAFTSTTFSAVGQGTYQIPAGAYFLQIDAIGGGGGAFGDNSGGSGCQVTATIPVLPQTDYSYGVGGGGGGAGVTGVAGGGGGSSYFNLADETYRIVAGGGGGAGFGNAGGQACEGSTPAGGDGVGSAHGEGGADGIGGAGSGTAGSGGSGVDGAGGNSTSDFGGGGASGSAAGGSGGAGGWGGSGGGLGGVAGSSSGKGGGGAGWGGGGGGGTSGAGGAGGSTGPAGAQFSPVGNGGTGGANGGDGGITVTPLESYSLSYNANGGTGTVPAESEHFLTTGSVTVQGNTGPVTKPGFTYAGWNTKADGSGTTYAPGAVVTLNSANIVLYAQWQADALANQTLPAGSHPKRIKSKGLTVLNKKDARTVQGQPVTAKVKVVSCRADVRAYRLAYPKPRGVNIRTFGKCALRVTVTYTAPGDSQYLAFKRKYTYRVPR